MTIPPEIIGLIALCIMLILLFLGLPVGVCMILIGLVGSIILRGANSSFHMVGLWTISSMNYTLALLPLFLLMGELANISGMMRDAFRTANAWMGHIGGGLAMASIFGAAAFSAVSGNSTACAAIMTRVALPQLLKYKYDPALATGALAAGGTLGNLIPPGILLVFYAVMTEASLGKLFIACIVPGILLMTMYMIQIYVLCKIKPSMGPAAPDVPWRVKIRELQYIVALFVVFVIVMGGIWTGAFTPNESAGIGTLVVFIYALAKRTLTGQNLTQAFKSSIITSGMAFAIFIGANMFSSFITLSRLPETLAMWIVQMNLSPMGLIIILMLVYFILGIPLNAVTMLMLTIPIILPLLNAFHIDLIWFGVLVVIQMELANLTPPVGMNLFIVSAMAKPRGISMATVFRGAWPFCVNMLVFNALLIMFPQIAMFLVDAMKK